MKKALAKSIPHLVLIPYVLIVVYPIYFIVISSLKKNNEIITNPWGLPSEFSFSHYESALTNSHLGTYFINSLYIATIATVGSLLLAMGIAFAVTRMRFPSLSKLVYGLLLLSLLIPPASLLIPLYIMVKDMGLYNTPLALIIPYMAFGIPLTVFVVAAFMKAIPTELEEAGIMDGLSAYGLLFRVVFPLSLPTLVTVFIINFLGHWNEYVMANLFLSTQTLRTLPVAVVGFADKFNMNYGALCASISISVIPIIIIFTFLQKQIIEGVTAGSVKG
ncbi:sugar ABC transporter permease [Paenibacillus tyrfis]|uniref:carbohydrate ABC transporter permease n=1 Tax=Paenibacillus tyrfis TaxID=1501230 RepID=UPI00249045C8|nr:carbohydrate ABC transporter permease [Paenibacillus tyrfis]GLI06513.1 sugar ABC transporter permease [Paenibacillus tyrfis]